MPLPLTHFQQITILYETLIVPPPYSHTYQFVVTPVAEALQVQYQLRYTERDSISEEEIAEEGFTADDDYTWEGKLPSVWLSPLQKMLEQTTQLKSQLRSGETNLIRLRVNDQTGTIHEGIPDNLEAWEYFLQELTQAVFEVSQKERPLEIHYREITAPKQVLQMAIKPSFSHRQLKIEIEEKGKRKEQSAEWRQLKPLLKAIFLPDYDASAASQKLPQQAGQYIDPGEGLWYQLGHSVNNPGKKYDAVGAMVREIKKLL